MKRLRLRKIWVVLAVLILMTPLLSGRMEKTDATGVSSTPVESSSGGNPSESYTVKFMVKNDDGQLVPDSGTNMPRFELLPAENAGTGFSRPNVSQLTAFISFNNAEVDITTFDYTPKWKIVVNDQLVYEDGGSSTGSVNVGDMAFETLDSDCTETKKSFMMQPSAAGIMEVVVTVELTKPGSDNVYTIDRHALITVPPQIYNKPSTSNHLKYAYAEPNGDLELLVNNGSSTIFWYYYDFKTKEYVKLEDPSKVVIDKRTSDSSYLIASIGDEVPNTDYPGNKVNAFKLKVNEYGGMSRIVGRIYLGKDPTSESYTEQTFDVLIKAKAKDTIKQIEYGDKFLFKDISNDYGNSLEWYVDEFSTRMPSVVNLIEGQGVIGKDWGEETVYLTPVPLYHGWDDSRYINREVKDEIKFITKFAVLKGDIESERVRAEAYEVVDIGGTLTLSTNVKNKLENNYTYTWKYKDGGDWIDLLNGSNPYVEVTRSAWAGSGDTANASVIKVKGIKAGTVELQCIVTGADVDIPLTQNVTLKVVDSISLSESRRKLAVGDSFELLAETSSIGTITWTSDDENFVKVEPVDSNGKTVKVTGVAVTGEQWITITATQVSSGRTAICKVMVVDALSPVRIEGDTVIAKGATGNLELVFEGNVPNYSADELEWIVKDKDGVAADTIIKLTKNQVDPTKVIVGGLEAGEAYVAVVLKEVTGGSTVKTELAVVTIRVVAKPEKLELSEENVIDDLKNSTYTLNATILPKGYVDEGLEILWTTSDPTIAEVVPGENNTGIVTYKALGKVIITATVKGAPNATDACHFEIQNQSESLTLSEHEISMKVGNTKILEATITPENVSDTSLTWDSSSPDVATVDRYGTVHALKAGSTIITCSTSNGKKDTCVVTVLKPVESITLNYDNITVKKGTIFYLSAQVNPIDAYDKSVTYSSSDTSIVTVDQDGTVTAVKVGTAEITVTSKDNPEVSAVCVVSVTESVSGITLNVKEKTIDVGEQFQLIATVRPSDSLNRNVTWTSSDPTIASVDENGLVTGIKGGKVIIMAKTEERGLMASCTITVQQDIEQIILSDTELYVGKGKTKKINYTLVPETATKKKLIWKSSNEGIAIVDADGNVHGVNLGTTTITATSQDDGKVKVTCKVTVINEAQTVTLNQTIIRIMEGEKYDLTATISPAGASVQKITWSTSDAAVARVDSMGRVTAVREGECTVRAAAADGGGAYGECRVIVTAAIPTTSVTVDSTETTMVVGDTRTMTARVLPRNTTESIRWVSGDTSVVTIDNNGNMKAVGPGVCKVTAISSSSGIEGVSTVTVLGLNAMSITLEQYDSFDLYLDGVPNGITWFSRNKRVASVTRGGVVTARMPGTTNVVARVNGKLVSCEITVEKIKK